CARASKRCWPVRPVRIGLRTRSELLFSLFAMFVDSHCHLDFPDLAEREDEIVAAMRDNAVNNALCISVTLEDFPRVLAVAGRHDGFFATVGVHPDNKDVEEPDVARLLELAAHPKVVGIGETGLDYYWHKDEPEWQRERFRTH